MCRQQLFEFTQYDTGKSVSCRNVNEARSVRGRGHKVEAEAEAKCCEAEAECYEAEARVDYQ